MSTTEQETTETVIEGTVIEDVVQPADAVEHEAGEPQTEEQQAKSQEVARRVATMDLSLDPNGDPNDLSPAQVSALKAIVNFDLAEPGAWPNTIAFLHMCVKRGLDPFAREAYLIARGKIDPKPRYNTRKYTMQTGIDGYRILASRTGKLIGVKNRVWTGQDDDDKSWRFDERTGIMRRVWYDQWPTSRGFPGAARVTIVHYDAHGLVVETDYVADWDMYCPLFDEYEGSGQNRKTTGRKLPGDMWAKGGPMMLSKCFSPDTEVLTDRGFRLFSEITTERVMQVTDDGLEECDARPFAQDYNGDMVSLDSDDLNFMVTPNHDMVTTVGKVEAGAMYASAGAPQRGFTWRIPRIVKGAQIDGPFKDEHLRLAAIIMADGYRAGDSAWTVKVARQRKRDALDVLDLHHARHIVHSKGNVSECRRTGHVIRSNFDQVAYTYRADLVADLLIHERSKRLHADVLRQVSPRQARIIVDTLIEFDGSTNKSTGVRRFGTSNLGHRDQFEVLAIKAGYSISPWVGQTPPLSERPNYVCSVSERDDIPVHRWGRERRNVSKGNTSGRTGLTLARNTSGKVWCVTVPSGVIVVRRNGHSMVCGNCGEAAGLRMAIPGGLNGLYIHEEMHRADQIEKDRAKAEANQRIITAHAERVTKPITDPAPAQPKPEPAAADEQPGEAPTGPLLDVGGPESPEQPRTDTPDPAASEPEAPSEAQVLTWLREEIGYQSAVLDKPVADLVKRQMDAAGVKQPGDLSAEDLAEVVYPNRRSVVSALRKAGREAEAEAYGQWGPGQVGPVAHLTGAPAT